MIRATHNILGLPADYAHRIPEVSDFRKNPKGPSPFYSILAKAYGKTQDMGCQSFFLDVPLADFLSTVCAIR